MKKQLQQLLDSQCGVICSSCNIKPPLIKKVYRLETQQLWGIHRQKVFSVHKQIRSGQAQNPVQIQAATLSLEMSWEVDSAYQDDNYIYLFHGSKAATVDRIKHDGFDPRYSTDCLYGNGVYFTDQFCKAAQYVDTAPNGEKFMFLARVMLGSPFMLKSHTEPEVFM